MLNTNPNNINVINKVFSDNAPAGIKWLQQSLVSNHYELSNEYANICQQHKQEKKWVLFINPEENSIDQLAKSHGIDASKILMVNYKNNDLNRTNIDLNKIKTVLSKGNCSAVILSNSLFKTDEIMQLENAASLGKTHCFLVKQSQIH